MILFKLKITRCILIFIHVYTLIFTISSYAGGCYECTYITYDVIIKLTTKKKKELRLEFPYDFHLCYPSTFKLRHLRSRNFRSAAGIHKFWDFSLRSLLDHEMSILWPLLYLCLEFATFPLSHLGPRNFCSAAWNPEILWFFLLEFVRPLNGHSLTSVNPLLAICNFSARSPGTPKILHRTPESRNFWIFISEPVRPWKLHCLTSVIPLLGIWNFSARSP